MSFHGKMAKFEKIEFSIKSHFFSHFFYSNFINLQFCSTNDSLRKKSQVGGTEN